MNALVWVLLAAGGIAIFTVLLIVMRRRDHSGPLTAVPTIKERVFSEEEEGFILEHMSEGILIISKRLQPEFANASARLLLGLQAGPLPGHLPSVEVGEVAKLALAEQRAQERLVDIWFPAQSTLKVQAIPLKNETAVLVVLQDASEEVRAQRIRTQFVANASHELKSPVASLQALAEAVREAVGEDPDTAVRFSARLVDEADRLGKLVSDLLDLSRLEDAGRVREDPCNLSDIARRETERLEPQARGDIIALTSLIEPELWIKGDEHQLGQMIRNLLENAIQYTPAGGSVTFTVKRTPDEVLVRIQDTGVGIPLEAQKRIFERFYRVDQARSREHGGTGLGLAIAKHVAELHGGSIELTSELGEGATFDVLFPLQDESAVEGTSKESA